MFEKDKNYLKSEFIYKEDVFSKEYAMLSFYYTAKYILYNACSILWRWI